MDTSQIRVQALQMALQARQQAASQAGAVPEGDSATVARAATYFAFLSGDSLTVPGTLDVSDADTIQTGGPATPASRSRAAKTADAVSE